MASSSSSNNKKIETTSSIAMEQLQHFSHEHELSLVQLHPDHNINENSDTESEDRDDMLVEDHHVHECKMCKEEIYSFHLSYYTCKECNYSLHRFCAQLPTTLNNHPLHPGHNLTLSEEFQSKVYDSFGVEIHSGGWFCNICRMFRNKFYNYHCSICDFDMDIICASMSEQKMDHPCHPHQLERYFRPLTSACDACNDEHTGTFYHCTTCSRFMIHLNCALLPAKLLIQQSTNENFSHPHLLTLAYSFPYSEIRSKFFPGCRVCDNMLSSFVWHYRCNKCRYYVHVDCAILPRDAFMSSILMPAGLGKTYKNFKDDLPNLIRCPFPDENDNLLMHLFINKGELVTKREIDGEMFCHPHPMILFDKLLNGSVSLHDPMKKVELFCDGCVRPITNVPFYKCSQQHCDFFLHEWCTRLPSEIKDHHSHPEHTLVLMPKIPGMLLGVFWCEICLLPSNGFAYGCIQCKYFVDVNCSFIPDVITHEAHSNHLLLRFSASSVKKNCKACRWPIDVGFHCPSCDFYLHTECALLLPKTIRHRYDKHALSLRYYPAENHSSEYFCEICEDEFNPTWWFYHCNTCAASSMHTACAPLKLQCERSTFSKYKGSVFAYFNIKFGRRYKHLDHPHPVTFVQGINADGQCVDCGTNLQYNMIFKCFACKFALHDLCGFMHVQEILDTSI